MCNRNQEYWIHFSAQKVKSNTYNKISEHQNIKKSEQFSKINKVIWIKSAKLIKLFAILFHSEICEVNSKSTRLICSFCFNWVIKNTFFLLIMFALVHRIHFVLKAFSEQLIYKTHVTGYWCFCLSCYFWAGTCLLRFTT